MCRTCEGLTSPSMDLFSPSPINFLAQGVQPKGVHMSYMDGRLKLDPTTRVDGSRRQCTSFQYSFFSIHARKVKMARNKITHTPIPARWVAMGSLA